MGMCCISVELSSVLCGRGVRVGGRSKREGICIYIYLTKPGMEPRSPSSQTNTLLSEPPGRILLPMQEPQEMQVRSLDWEDPLEEEMATHSSILAWRTEETGGLQPMGSQRVRHD